MSRLWVSESSINPCCLSSSVQGQTRSNLSPPFPVYLCTLGLRLSCLWYIMLVSKNYPQLIVMDENLFNEFWVINLQQMGALSKTDYKDGVYFFHLGLSAWHAKLLRVYSSQRLPPIGVQKLETHHSFPASEDMVSKDLLQCSPHSEKVLGSLCFLWGLCMLSLVASPGCIPLGWVDPPSVGARMYTPLVHVFVCTGCPDYSTSLS